MPVKIVEIKGPEGFFRVGDEIVSIDGHALRDQLDLHYRLAVSDSVLVRVRRSMGRTFRRRLRSETIERAGLVLDRMHFKSCASRCIFCFVDQMPPRLRGTLYCKDDDYRLSFLYGNYITLNDTSRSDIDRIMELHLSPLYVSVHATDRSVRARLFGRPMHSDILKTLKTLTEAGITVHAQIVLVPGINDGNVLERTIDGLAGLFPGVRTLAIVPVGLTAHRTGLEPIGSVTPSTARKLLDHVKEMSETIQAVTGPEPFLHCSDEFYLLSRRAFPPAAAYGGFEQLSNGVGMCRLFIDDVTERAESLARRSRRIEGSMTLVTGRLGASFFRRYVLPIVVRVIPGLRIDLLPVRNRLFGDTVGVSGLLAGADIVAAARNKKTGGCLILPPNAVNYDGLLIDDMRPAAIGRLLGRRVVVPKHDFLERTVLGACIERETP
jgi:putative radical SAM enzyme (TIGR03279 family)